MSGRQPESPTISGICRHLCENHQEQVGAALVEVVVNEATTTPGTEAGEVVFRSRTGGRCLSSINSGVRVPTESRCSHGCTFIEVTGGTYNLETQTGAVFFQPKPAIEP